MEELIFGVNILGVNILGGINIGSKYNGSKYIGSNGVWYIWQLLDLFDQIARYQFRLHK